MQLVLIMYILRKIPIENKNSKFEIFDLDYVDVSDLELNKISKKDLTNSIQYNYYIGTEKKQSHLFFYLVPFRKISNSIQKVSQFKIRINQNDTQQEYQKKQIVSNSILSTGNWHKIGITESGIYEIDANFLNSMGVDISTINPKNIRVYGNKAGMLEEG